MPTQDPLLTIRPSDTRTCRARRSFYLKISSVSLEARGISDASLVSKPEELANFSALIHFKSHEIRTKTALKMNRIYSVSSPVVLLLSICWILNFKCRFSCTHCSYQVKRSPHMFIGVRIDIISSSGHVKYLLTQLFTSRASALHDTCSSSSRNRVFSVDRLHKRCSTFHKNEKNEEDIARGSHTHPHSSCSEHLITLHSCCY